MKESVGKRYASTTLFSVRDELFFAQVERKKAKMASKSLTSLAIPRIGLTFSRLMPCTSVAMPFIKRKETMRDV